MPSKTDDTAGTAPPAPTIEDVTARAEQAEAALANARTEAADVTAKLGIAEKLLADAEEAGKAAAQRVRALEQDVANHLHSLVTVSKAAGDAVPAPAGSYQLHPSTLSFSHGDHEHETPGGVLTCPDCVAHMTGEALPA